MLHRRCKPCLVSEYTDRRFFQVPRQRGRYGFPRQLVRRMNLLAVQNCLLEDPIKDQSVGADTSKTTPLETLHKSRHAQMVPFAGHLMPLNYTNGIISEHNHTRTYTSLFDVSHMGQISISGKGASRALETLVPGNITGLSQGSMRYTMLTNDEGGILDDIIVTRQENGICLVVNAACLKPDFAHIRSRIGSEVDVDIIPDRVLLALQGPGAAINLETLIPKITNLPFMTAQEIKIEGIQTVVSRCGYTGEDGFEISVPAENAEALARKVLNLHKVELAGLGARDTLRLEAGLCLYGQDINAATTPIEAGLNWTIPERRHKEGTFPGAKIIEHQLKTGISKKLVGFYPSGRAIVRTGAQIKSLGGQIIGTITSGSFGPTVGGPVAMGYIASSHAKDGTSITLDIRGKPVSAVVTNLPFVPHRYFKCPNLMAGEK